MNIFKYIGIKTMTITFCACRSDADTLLRNHLFPSSPVLPRAGFHLKLLEFYSVLRVEGHVSCQAFSYTCSYVHNYSVSYCIFYIYKKYQFSFSILTLGP